MTPRYVWSMLQSQDDLPNQVYVVTAAQNMNGVSVLHLVQHVRIVANKTILKMCRSRANNSTSATARQLPAMPKIQVLHSNSADEQEDFFMGCVVDKSDHTWYHTV